VFPTPSSLACSAKWLEKLYKAWQDGKEFAKVANRNGSISRSGPSAGRPAVLVTETPNVFTDPAKGGAVAGYGGSLANTPAGCDEYQGRTIQSIWRHVGVDESSPTAGQESIADQARGAGSPNARRSVRVGKFNLGPTPQRDAVPSGPQALPGSGSGSGSQLAPPVGAADQRRGSGGSAAMAARGSTHRASRHSGVDSLSLPSSAAGTSAGTVSAVIPPLSALHIGSGGPVATVGLSYSPAASSVGLGPASNFAAGQESRINMSSPLSSRSHGSYASMHPLSLQASAILAETMPVLPPATHGMPAASSAASVVSRGRPSITPAPLGPGAMLPGPPAPPPKTASSPRAKMSMDASPASNRSSIV
jgi:hypothetical protein